MLAEAPLTIYTDFYNKGSYTPQGGTEQSTHQVSDRLRVGTEQSTRQASTEQSPASQG
jgi:hypothetical protein